MDIDKHYGKIMLGMIGVAIIAMTIIEVTAPSREEKIARYHAAQAEKQLGCIEDGGVIELVGTSHISEYCAYPDGTKLRIFNQ